MGLLGYRCTGGTRYRVTAYGGVGVEGVGDTRDRVKQGAQGRGRW